MCAWLLGAAASKLDASRTAAAPGVEAAVAAARAQAVPAVLNRRLASLLGEGGGTEAGEPWMGKE